MCIKIIPPLVFYWELSRNNFVRNHVMIWQNHVWSHSKRASLKKEGKVGWQIKVTKSDVGEGFAAENVMGLTQKNRDIASDVLFEWTLWCFILLYYLWVYLLMLLAFYETNKPYISKWIFIIYTKQDVSRTTWLYFAKRVKRWTSKVGEGIL